MTPSAFSYARPQGIDEAVALLHECPNGAKILAGGQSLVPLLASRALRPRLVIDINRLPELDQIELHSDHIRMGALVRQEAARLSPVLRAHVPALVAALEWVASPVIRERGTVIGNLAANTPGSELPAVAIALGCQFVVRGRAGARLVAARELLGLQGQMPSDAFITHVLWPKSPGRAGFYEVARREGHAPVVGAMAHLGMDDCRIGLCGVTAVGVSCDNVAREVFTRFPHRLTSSQIDQLLERDLNLPLYGNAFVSVAYRREVAPVVIQRAIDNALRREYD